MDGYIQYLTTDERVKLCGIAYKDKCFTFYTVDGRKIVVPEEALKHFGFGVDRS